jgi:xylan 1,4-beta-xylosidase
VNWRVIGHAITESEWLDLSDIAESHGIWAPDISYHNGLFYIFLPFRLNNKDDGLNPNATGRLRTQLVMTSPTPEGPYSKPWNVEVDSIDPSHFIDDDGTHYMVTAKAATVTMLDETCKKILKPPTLVWAGIDRASEAPHILKKDGWYYVMLAEGGTGYGHMITSARSRSIYGPYEPSPYNPVMTQKDPDHPIQKAGHGKLVQTQNGDWWCVYLCSRPNEGKYSTLGRETALDPVTWTDDGWFIVNGLKGPSVTQTAPALPEHKFEPLPARDDFDNLALRLDWVFVRNPKHGNWSLSERPGYLRLKGSLYDLCERRAYNTIVRRETEHSYTVTAKLEYEPTRNGQEAGLVCYSGIYTYIKLCKCYEDGEIKFKVIENRNDSLRVLGVISAPDCPAAVYLKITVDKQVRGFYYSIDSENWTHIAAEDDCTFMCTEEIKVGKHHTGTMVGMYHHNPAYSFADADFDWFEYKA